MKETFKKLIKNIYNSITKSTFNMEALFFMGLFLIIITNFMINFYLGMYFLGVMFIVYSVFLYKVSSK
jgi:hypothetical protein